MRFIPIILIFVLIFLNAVLSASELALVSLSKRKIEFDLKENKKRAKKAQKILNIIEQPTSYLSTIQVVITMIGFVNALIAASIFSNEIAVNLASYFNVSLNLMISILNFLITIFLTTLQVIFGELVPKRISLKSPESTAYLFIDLISLFKYIMKPFVWTLTGISNSIVRLFGVNLEDYDDTLTEEELRLELHASELKGEIDETESEMIQNIFEFDDTIVEEVMTHRTEVSAFDITSTREDVIKHVTKERFTRFPIYDGSIDHIIGTLHVKDLLIYIDKNPDPNIFNLNEILREPLFVPQSINTRQLFKDMQASKTHIAIVIDEYGGTAGIITIEDLIEEIVGNIFDEYDDDKEEIEELPNDQYEIDGLADIEEVDDKLKANLPIEEYDTLSGFILGQLGRFPEVDEKVVIVYNNYRFEVLSFKDKVVEKVKAYKIEQAIEKEEDGD